MKTQVVLLLLALLGCGKGYGKLELVCAPIEPTCSRHCSLQVDDLTTSYVLSGGDAVSFPVREGHHTVSGFTRTICMVTPPFMTVTTGAVADDFFVDGGATVTRTYY